MKCLTAVACRSFTIYDICVGTSTSMDGIIIIIVFFFHDRSIIRTSSMVHAHVSMFNVPSLQPNQPGVLRAKSTPAGKAAAKESERASTYLRTGELVYRQYHRIYPLDKLHSTTRQHVRPSRCFFRRQARRRRAPGRARPQLR